MWETSNSPACSRTARCSARMPAYCTGIAKPANSTMRAPRATWRSKRGVRRSPSLDGQAAAFEPLPEPPEAFPEPESLFAGESEAGFESDLAPVSDLPGSDLPEPGLGPESGLAPESGLVPESALESPSFFALPLPPGFE